MSLLRPRPARSSSPSTGLPQQRATLEGLEVQDSTWDEWVACERAAQEQQQTDMLASGTGPMRRLMQQ